jgi:hypothetical protein
LPADSCHTGLDPFETCDVADKQSRLLMDGLHACANCHSFSADGRTMGLDMDVPQNDKGLYTIVKLQPHTTIGTQDQIA